MPIKWNTPWKLSSSQGDSPRCVFVCDAQGATLINCGIESPANILRAMVVTKLVNELFETDPQEGYKLLEDFRLELERLSGPHLEDLAETDEE